MNYSSATDDRYGNETNFTHALILVLRNATMDQPSELTHPKWWDLIYVSWLNK